MKISYDEGEDYLYIGLSDKEATEWHDIDSVVIHLDYWGDICGMEWNENASEKVDLSRLDVEGIPKEPRRGDATEGSLF